MAGQENPLNATEQMNDSLPAPMFDERAAAKAQPVQPLSSNRFLRWLQRAQLNKFFTRRVLALAIVIVSGVVAGAAGGAMLVKQRDANDNATVEHQTPQETAEVAPVDTAFQASTTADADAVHSRRPSRRRLVRSRAMSYGQAPQRAYKVATIR